MVATLSKQMGLPLTQVIRGIIVSHLALALRVIHCALVSKENRVNIKSHPVQILKKRVTGNFGIPDFIKFRTASKIEDIQCTVKFIPNQFSIVSVCSVQNLFFLSYSRQYCKTVDKEICSL